MIENKIGRKFEIFLLITFIFTFGIAALLLGQDMSWDLLNYHFYNGYAFIHQRYFWDISPAWIQNYLNPFFDVLNYWLLSTQKAFIAIFILGAITGISAFILFKIAMIIFREFGDLGARILYSLCAVTIGMMGVANFSTVGLASNDNKMGLLVIGSIFCAIKSLTALQATTKHKWTIGAGILMGFATAFKLVTGCYAIGLGIGLLFSRRLDKEQLILCLTYGISFLIAFALTGGLWMYFLYDHFGNPFFPYYNNFFHSTFIEANNFKDLRFYPHHTLTFPFYLASKSQMFEIEHMLDSRLAVLYLLSITFLIKIIHDKFSSTSKDPSYIHRLVETCRNSLYLSFPRRRESSRAERLDSRLRGNDKFRVFSSTSDFLPSQNPLNAVWRLLIIWFLVSYFLWFQTFTIYRYIVPLELIAGIFIVFLTRKILPKISHHRNLLLVMIFYFLFSTVYIKQFTRIPFNFTKEDFTRDFFVFDNFPDLPPQSTVLITAPYAALIPFFPKDAKFINIFALGDYMEKNAYNRPTLLNQKARDMIYNSNGPLYILCSKWNYDKFKKKNFVKYGMKQNGNCQEFETNIRRMNMRYILLCPITATKPNDISLTNK